MTDAASRDLAARFAGAGLDWIVPAWPAANCVQSFSTTRNGGVSRGPYATLNLGFGSTQRATRDSPDAIAENRLRVAAFLPSPPIWLDQTHGADVAIVDRTNADVLRADPPFVDAAITREPGAVLTILAADCLPIVLAARDGSAVGIAHAGWRGLARGVVDNAIDAMQVAPGDVVAWLGPAIGPTAFEVGADVRSAFVERDAAAGASFRPKSEGKWLADLYSLARLRLERAGVRNVHGGGYCTHDDAARFFSYRRDRETGRMATFAWIA